MKTYLIYVGRKLMLRFQAENILAADKQFDELTPNHPKAKTITMFEGRRSIDEMCCQLKTETR